jgi:guanylate kinase
MKKKNPNPTPKPLLVVLSGPSGAGKDAVLNHMKASGYPAKFITTNTTRPKRANEQDNIAYHFVSEKEFQKMLKNKELLEYANVYGNWYGVPREPIRQALESRLRERQTESEFDCDLRLKTAVEETKQLHLFDYVVFNERNEIERAASAIAAIITAEKCRRTPRQISL